MKPSLKKFLGLCKTRGQDSYTLYEEKDNSLEIFHINCVNASEPVWKKLHPMDIPMCLAQQNALKIGDGLRDYVARQRYRLLTMACTKYLETHP